MEKKTSSANRLVLKKILSQEGNNRCADCKTATHPRWASWNIGILICIRCSGIHRSLGTHISKVRSIDLDTWNDFQLEKLVELGNSKANKYWESKLPANYVPDESKIVSFIKTKYELKRWVPDDDDVALSTKASAKAPQLPPKVRDPPTRAVDLLDLDGAFSMKSSTVSGTPSSSTGNLSDISTKSAPVTNNFKTTRTSSVPAAPVAQPRSAQSVSQQASSTSNSSARADVKKSILSLYSQQSSRPVTPGSTSSFNLGTSFSNPSSRAPSTISLNTGSASSHASSQSLVSTEAEDVEDNFANVWNQ